MVLPIILAFNADSMEKIYNKTLYCSDVIGWLEAILDNYAIKSYPYFVHVASKTTESLTWVALPLSSAQRASFVWATWDKLESSG